MSRPAFLVELKRRNLDRAAIFYGGAAWLLVQIITQVSPYFDVASWVVRAVIVTAVVGFPFAMAFAWFYELTPEGIKRESELLADPAATHRGGKKLDRAIIAILTVLVVLLIANQVVSHRDTTGASEQSVAVMPLVNSTGDAGQEYFSDGMSEELISSLSRLQKLRVISRNSSFKFKGKTEDSKAIGEALKVAYLVEGSVRKSQDRLRIAVALVRASDGSNTWSDTYDRDAKDVFAVQSEIATAVANQLKVSVLGENAKVLQQPSPGAPANQNLKAYNALLQGNFFYSQHNDTGYRRAIDQYRRAIQLDSGYALAHARLSHTLSRLLSRSSFDPAQRKLMGEEALAEAQTALRLAPTLAAAHLTLGAYHSDFDLNLSAAESAYQRAVELDPNGGGPVGSLGVLRGSFGQLDEAVALTRQAIARDPLNAGAYFNLGLFQMAGMHLAEAEAAYRQGLALQPQAEVVYARLAVIKILQEKPADALALAQKEPSEDLRDQALAIAFDAQGDHTAAQAALQRLIAKHADESASQIASVFAYRKDPTSAFQWLQHALDAGDTGVAEMRIDPFLIPYRSDPRFLAIARKAGVLTAAELATQH